MLRVITIVAVVAFAAGAVAPRDAVAAGVGGERAASAPSQQEDGTAEVDDNDDTRVEVQLVVLGIAAAVVVIGGGIGYFIRHRLGLDKPPDEQPAAHH